MKHIFSVLFIALWSITAWGQEGGDGFNPDNPGEPGQRYNLTINVTPDGTGTTSPSGKRQYATGESVHLKAYANSYYQFAGWVQDGDTISRNTYFDYVMLAKNVTVTATFKPQTGFNPDNPGDPSPEVIKHKLILAASPAEGGYFNITSGERFSEGKTISVYAYPNSNYQFEGWKQGDRMLSTESEYSFVMGKEDVSLTGLFRFNPANPGNPGANHWNAETGELIVDDFTPGSIMNAVDAAIGGSGNRGKVSMVIVSGRMNSQDIGFVNYLSNCTLLDLSRTGGYTEIHSYALDGTNLSTVILPACVEKIGYYAFVGCKNLSDIICYALTPPAADDRAFEGIAEGAVVHVLSSAIPLYEEAPVWKDFTILPLTEDVRTLEVNLPAGSEGVYKSMTLELQNQQNGQKQRYVVSDRITYTFNGLLKNCTYNVSLKTPADVVLGQIENIEIKDENRSVTFASLLALLDVALQVQAPDGTDVTSQVQITWLDSKQAYLSQGNLLKAQTAGTEVGYRIVLNQELGMQYVAPESQTYSVKEKENRPVYTLVPIETVTVSGMVKEVDGSALSGATVSVSQKLNGKYSKSFIAQTDAKGKFELQVFNDESTVSVSAANYVSRTLTKADFSEGTDLGTIELKTISGATINLSLTYTPSVAEGEEATTEEWYSDYANVSYELYNVTQGKAITDFSVQYPSIVLLEEVAAGDQIRITASSKNNAFLPVTATATIDEAAKKADATVNIVAWGGIKASYATTDNSSVVGILYDSKGELMKKYTYSNQSLSIGNLSDGTYTLVSMANSTFFNSILRLSQLAASGLTEGTDYVQNNVTVKSGVLSPIANSHIPALDESKLYYTGENTSFTVNKASIVAGNYLTLKGKIDFKEEYAGSVSNIRLVVDLPEECSYVENSAMAGSTIASYTIDNNRLTIPLNDYTELVRFCVIPTAGGSYQPNAFVEFALSGKEISQPIGSAFYEVKDLSISVPKIVAKPSIPISGTAQGGSTVEIYDNGILIGQTTALGNGLWSVACELNEPYNLSTHSIYAKVTTKQGMELQSETQEFIYDKDAIEVSSVTMNFYNGWLKQNIEVVFDFQSNTTNTSSYMFYTETELTFIIDFTNNDPEVVSNVVLNVFTDQNEIRKLIATYDNKKGKWIATSKFSSNNLPINLSVDFDADTQSTFDGGIANQLKNDYIKETKEQDIINDEIDNIFKQIEAELEKENTDLEKVEALSDSISIYYIIDVVKWTPEEDDDIENTSNIEDPEELIKHIDEKLSRPNEEYNQIVSCYPPRYNEALPAFSQDGKVITPSFTYKKSTPDDPTTVYIPPTDWTVYPSDIENSHNQLHLISKSTNDEFIIDYSNMGLPQEVNTEAGFNNYVNSVKDLCDWYLEKYRNDYGWQSLEAILNQRERELLKDKAYIDKVSKKAINKVIKRGDIKKSKDLIKQLTEKRKPNTKALKETKRLKNLTKWGSRAIGAVSIGVDSWDARQANKKWHDLIDKIHKLCDADEAARIAKIANDYKEWLKWRDITKIGSNIILTTADWAGKLGAGASGGLSLALPVLAVCADAGLDYWKYNYQKTNKEHMREVRNEVNNSDKCKDLPPDEEDDDPTSPTFDPIKPIHDPSGYVYEAVETNRLQGVTATCYYKEMVEDMYGDLHEEIKLWDAAEYAQENPLFTDENGMYAWDVPQGLWQVKFEKEGYQTTYSDWLPVPPPQLEVNVGMVQAIQPTVTAVRGYETGIEVDFSKFMLPETMTAELITATRNGEAVAGEVTFKNAETNPLNKGEQYVSKVRFVPAEALATTDKVVLTVSKRVKSYAGIQMESDYSQEIAIEKEPKAVVDSKIEVVYGETAEITVTVEPKEASAGKKVTAASVSGLIASITPAEATLDAEGKATFTVSGELPGQTMIQFAVEGTDMKPEMTVSVVEAGEKEITRSYNLVMGWNWFSINVQAPNLNDLSALLSPIRESVITLKGANGEPGSLNATQSYKIKMKKDAVLELRGKAAAPADNTITLVQGWNWIGYVPATTLPLEQALQNLQPEKGDVIKALDSFAVYDGNDWIGSLTHLAPGEGYMYYSQTVKSFNYATTDAEDNDESSSPAPQWNYDAHLSEDNLIAVAELYDNDRKAEAGKFLVGIFAGEECRGIAVEKEGRLFITAHGEQADGKLTLRAFDTTEQKEYFIKEEMEWSRNLTGTLDAPVGLHLGELTGILSVTEGVLIYPSPVRDRLYIRGDIGNIEEIRIANAAGQTLILAKEVLPNEGVSVSSLAEGIYFITVKAGNKVIRQKFMKVD